VINYVPDSSARTADNNFRITGFTINANNATGGHGIIVRNESTTVISKVRIDHNTILNAASRGVFIIGNVFGVADNNTITGFYHGMDQEGYSSGLPQWAAEATLGREYGCGTLCRNTGTAHNFYFEDNTLNSLTTSNAFHAGGTGGRYVARYNSYNQPSSGNLQPHIDIHGNQSAAASFMVNEIYGNKFTMAVPNNLNYIVDQRGSKLLAFMNQYNTTTNTTGHYFRIRDEFADSNVSAPSGNPGGYLMHVTDSYFWNNRHVTYSNYLIKAFSDANGDPAQTSPENCCYQDCGYGQDSACCYNTGGTEGIKENIDFFNHNTSYNGTTQRGIYCGTLLPANCTTGDGAWITTQSCSSVDDAHVGANPSTPISGTLYKCTATDTWEAYYTPYTYPHPLRGEVATTTGTIYNGAIGTGTY
jgi:hypothetical protein